MFTQHEKRIKHACYILLILMMLFGIVGSMTRPAQAAAPVLVQFTSSGHALGFTANGIYAAAGTHALRVDFVNANNVQPRADSPADPSTSLREAPPWGRIAVPNRRASRRFKARSNANAFFRHHDKIAWQSLRIFPCHNLGHADTIVLALVLQPE